MNKYDVNKFVLLFFNSVLNYLNMVSLEKPILSTRIEENKKVIKTIMHNPQQCADSVYRAKNNLVISLDGFRYGPDQTLYNMLYDMLELMHKYFHAETDEQRVQIKYDMEQLYYKWGYAVSRKNSMEQDMYHIKQMVCEGKMKVYKLMRVLFR